MTMKRIGKTLAVLTLAVVALALTSMAAFAQGPNPADQAKARPGGVRGEVVAKAARGFEVKTASGDLRKVAVDNDTKFRQPGEKNVTFKDLQVGDRVTVVGRAQKDAPLLARLVNIEAPRPKIHRLLGTVTDAGKDSITVKTLKGESVTVKLNDKTRIVPKDTKIQAGDHVLVLAAQARGSKDIVARLIAVKGSKAPGKT
jgi:hypothetical protein